jgi:hypothetical protein
MRCELQLFLPIISVLACCSPNTSATKAKLQTVNFCELPDYKDQKVLLTCLYSGYEEYWSLSALDSTKCNSRLNVELDFLDDYGQIPMRFRRIIRKVHKLYPIKALEVKVIGVFGVLGI